MLNQLLHFVLGLALVAALSLIVCPNKKDIKIRFIIQILVIEILFAWFLMYSSVGVIIIQGITSVFSHLMAFSDKGANFVFGDLIDPNKSIVSFFIKVLCPIIFISALIGILKYAKILPLCIKVIGTALSKVNGMGKLESFNAVGSLMVGQSENFVLFKEALKNLPEKRMYTLAATALSTVSMSIVGAYMTMLEPKYVVAALILNMLSTFVVLSLLNPYAVDESESEVIFHNAHAKQDFFEMLVDYILIGFKIACIVAAVLIGFIALIAMINALFSFILGISFQELLGYLFFPLAWIMGIPSQEALQVGSIMATKLVSNEFVAMIQLQEVVHQLSPRSIGILSIFLVSFSNFASVGMIAGAVKGLDDHQGKVVSRFTLKLVYGSTLVSILSGTIAGLVL